MELKHNTTASIEHLVFFWLKDPESADDRTEFEKAMRKLLNTSVNAVQHHFGKPAAIDRPVIDTSYTYCLKITFENRKQHDSYQIEPAHKLFISEASKLWERVLIYDSESIL